MLQCKVSQRTFIQHHNLGKQALLSLKDSNIQRNSRIICIAAFLGFNCPVLSQEELLRVGHPKYAHANDCKRFFFCVNGIHPRLGVCGDFEAYDPVEGTCRPAEEVSGW